MGNIAAVSMPKSPDSQLNDPVFDQFPEDSEDRSSGNTDITPNSEFSPPASPEGKNAVPTSRTDYGRAKARSLAASLSLKEQVRKSSSLDVVSSHIDLDKVSLLVGGDFWRSQAIPAKGIPSFKTSDGPNGARGAIFKAGTKVSQL